MWMEKIRHGILEVNTNSGVRYVEPSLGERLQLLWTFRNFHVLSEEVLNQHERQLVGQLCTGERLKRPTRAAQPSVCVIGTVEKNLIPGKKPHRRVE